MSYNGISFENDARIRSEFQRLIGEQNIEAKLDKLAKDPGIMNSIYNMEQGPKSAEPSKMVHNIIIGNIFKEAKAKAWAQLRQMPDVQVLIEKDRKRKADQFNNNSKVNRENRVIQLSNMPN